MKEDIIDIGVSNKIYSYIEFKYLLDKLKGLEVTINKMNEIKPIRTDFEIEMNIQIRNNEKVQENKNKLFYEDVFEDLLHLSQTVFSEDFYDILTIKPIEMISDDKYLTFKYQMLINIER